MNPRHYSQIETAVQCFNKSSTVNLLKDNKYLLFLFKKAERFAAALYILTELFLDSEPLKWELRALGADLCKDIFSFRERSTSSSKENIGNVFITIVRIASLLEIAHIANLVSGMNCTIFRRELDILSSFIESRGKTNQFITGSSAFTDDFFRVPREFFETAPPRGHPSGTIRGMSPNGAAGSSAEATASSGGVDRGPRKDKDEPLKGHLILKDTVLYDSRKIDKGQITLRRMNEERRKIILEVFKTRDAAVVRDFSFVIQGCSEKTIQRELLRLVRDGVLKKEGERRWSRYSLANVVK